METMPNRLFRYYGPAAKNIFEEKKLWFSAATDFNDVFDICPRYDEMVPTIESEIKKAWTFLPLEHDVSLHEFATVKRFQQKKIYEQISNKYTKRFVEEFSKEFGILCFTTHLHNLLMWGHYADCHKGFVIEFDPKHLLFSEGFDKVTYSKIRPMISPDNVIFYTKSEEWSYENEHRLIVHRNNLKQGKRERYGRQVDGFYLPLPTKAIKAVYFGCQIEPDVRTIILKSLPGHPKIGQFYMRKNPREFKLDVVEWK